MEDMAPDGVTKDLLTAIATGIRIKLSTNLVGWELFAFKGLQTQVEAFRCGDLPYGMCIAHCIVNKTKLKVIDQFPYPAADFTTTVHKMFQDFLKALAPLAVVTGELLGPVGPGNFEDSARMSSGPRDP